MYINKNLLIMNMLKIAGNFKQFLKPKIKEMASIYMKVPMVFAYNKERKFNIKEPSNLQTKTKSFKQKPPYEPIFPEVLKTTPQKKNNNDKLVLILNVFAITSFFRL